MKKFCITFAGAVGSSKSPIANYLSGKLNLPVFNNDIIRTEVQEDMGKFDEVEYKKRRNERAEALLKSGVSFIYDASVDREWDLLKKWLIREKYNWFIISLDLSKDLLLKLYKIKEYADAQQRLEQLFLEHQVFLDKYSKEVGVHITDEQFYSRLSVAYIAVKESITTHAKL